MKMRKEWRYKNWERGRELEITCLTTRHLKSF